MEASLKEDVSGGFSNYRDREAKGNGALAARLYQEIGQLKVERDFLAGRSVHKYGAVTGNGCQHICMGVTWWKETYWEKGCIQLVFDRQGGE